MPITRKVLAAYDWVTVFEAPTVRVMAARGNSNVHILHVLDGTRVRKIEYNMYGRRFTSPSEAIKYHNAEEARRLRKEFGIAGGRHAPGSPKQALPITRVLPRR